MTNSESKQTNEIFRPETIELISINALQQTYKRIVDLGKKGEELLSKNQFGDTALRADIEAEEVVISALKLAKIPLILLSEEHGRVEIGEKQNFLGVLDGIDGSGLFKKDRKNGRYGTMFAIYQGTDPTYSDYLFCGIMEHATKRLFYATKTRGASLFLNGTKEKIMTSGKRTLDKASIRISLDDNFDGAFNTTVIHDVFYQKLSDYQRIPRIDATSAHYVDLITGVCDLVLECTRKGNLELAVGYGLVRESGGDIVDLQGQSLNSKKLLEFGQDRYVPFVAAATQELAQQTASFLQA